MTKALNLRMNGRDRCHTDALGWFACVSDEMPETEWERQFGEMLDALPDDTLLTVVDCHI